LLDIAPTALDLVGISGDFSGQSVLSIKPYVQRDRIFHRYAYDEFWSGEAISYDSWLVNGAVADLGNWSLQDMFYKETAPSNYPRINYDSLSRTSSGLSLDRSEPNSKSAWISGSEFSILVGTQKPREPAVISLSMKPPSFMTADTQVFSVEINHHRLDQSFSLSNRENWSDIEIAVPANILEKGNNLITLNFSQTASMQEHRNWRTAGELRSFSLIQ
jgi:hypothetical protein